MLLANKYFPMHLWNIVNHRFVSVESLELVGCKDIIYRVLWLIKLNSEVPAGKIHTTKFCFYHRGVNILLLSFQEQLDIIFKRCVGKSEKKSLLERQRRQWIYEEETNTTQIFTFFSENEMVDIVFTRRKPIHPKTFQVGGSVVAVNLPCRNQYNPNFQLVLSHFPRSGGLDRVLTGRKPIH